MPMRTLFCLVLATALVLPGGPRSVGAAVEVSIEQPGPTLELIVIEARGCPMCRLFRDEIAPAYRVTARAKRAPMRFVDVSFTDPATLNLAAPVEIVPTVVLMRDGAEIDRLVGYTGPEIFMSVVGRMLGDTP
jgi:thioredoxin-related protein